MVQVLLCVCIKALSKKLVEAEVFVDDVLCMFAYRVGAVIEA